MSITAMKQALEALEKCKKALAEELSAWDIDPPLHHVLEAHDLCDPAVTALRQAIEQAEKQGGDQVIRSIKQEAETGLVVGDKVGMRDALQQILREADKHLGIEV